MAQTPRPAKTNVLYVDYRTDRFTHTMAFRVSAAAVPESAAASIETNFLDLLVPLWWQSTRVTGYRFRRKGSVISLPVQPPSAFPQGTAGGSQPTEREPVYLTVSGRGLNRGEEARLLVFGTVFTPDADYRLPVNSSPEMFALLSGLQTLADSNLFITDSEDAVTVRPYVNVGYHAYYQRKMRG